MTARPALVAAILVLATAGAAVGAGTAVDSPTGLVGSPSTEALGATSAAQTNNATNTVDRSPNVSVGVGNQLATVLTSATESVRWEIEASAFSYELETDDDGMAVDRRLSALADRAGEIRASYRNATAAFVAGNASVSTFAQRMAILRLRAEGVAYGLRTVETRLANASTDPTFQAALRALEPIVGAGPSAILDRYVGSEDGELSIEAEDGLVIRARGENGSYVRDVDRDVDDDDDGDDEDDRQPTVNRSTAVSVATSALENVSGTWELISEERDDGDYEFEFALRNSSRRGEAEVTVDGDRATVLALETEIEDADGDDEVDHDETDAEEVAEDESDETEDDGAADGADDGETDTEDETDEDDTDSDDEEDDDESETDDAAE